LTALGIASEAVHFGTFTGSTIGDNLTAKAIFQALESAIESIDFGTISDIDNLPGDTIDNNLIDKAIVQDSGNWDTAYGWGNHASAGYATSNHDHNLVYALIDHTHDYSSVFAALDHTHALLYQPLDTDLTALAGISGQRGDVLYYGASGWTRLGKGTLGYVLTQGENDPVWAAATGGSFSGDASDVDYDNTESDLEATDVQGAIDEVVGMIGAIEVGEPTITGTLAAVEDTSGVTASQYWGSDALGAMGYHDLPEGGSMVYPGAGVPVSTGSAWGTSLTVGTGASNLVQLDESGKLPAVDGSSLTGLFDPASPGAIGGTTPAAATFTTLSAGATGFSVDADGDVTAKSLSITRVTGQASYSEYFEVPANGDNKVTVKPADSLAADYTVTLPSATGTLQLAGAEVDLPSSDADPDTTGEIRHDSTITGLLRGALKWFDGTGARILVDLDTAPSDDDYVVSYDANADKFYMKADATGAVGDQLVDIVTTAPLLVNGGANVNDVLPGSDADITFSVQDASTSQKGVAQFSSDNFAASNGTITVKDDGIAAAEIADLYGFELIPIAWAADGTSAPDALNDTGRKPWKYRTFASDADEDVNFVWQIPSDATVGASANNFWYRVHYLVTAATGPTASEGVAFSLAGASMGDNDATNAAKGSAVTITDDELNAAQWDYMVTDWSSAVTITNAAAGEMAELNLERTTGDDVDDYGQDVGVAFIEIRYVKNPTR
jgi:hypothetical protein